MKYSGLLQGDDGPVFGMFLHGASFLTQEHFSI